MITIMKKNKKKKRFSLRMKIGEENSDSSSNSINKNLNCIKYNELKNLRKI